MAPAPEVAPAKDSAQTYWFGNATTALYVALKAVGCRNRHVAVTPNVCPNVVAAILASSNTPYFVDIELERFGPDPAAFEDLTVDLGAIVVVHAYGIPCLVDRILEIARRRGIPVIEDCAQAEGAKYLGAPVGGFGDVAVFSYGAGKIIDAGGGGRAVTASPDVAGRIADEQARLKVAHGADVAAELGAWYKFFYNNFYPSRLAPYRGIFTTLMRDFGTRLLSGFDGAFDRGIAAGHEGLQENIHSRLKKADSYTKRLSGNAAIHVLTPPDGAVYWRYNVFLEPDVRDRVLRGMLNEGHNVSSWYPDISGFLDPGSFRGGPLPNSRWFADRILNLWLTPETTDVDIDAACREVLALLN